MLRLISSLIVLVLGATPVYAAEPPTNFIEGQHYQRIAHPQRVNESGDASAKREVVEVFWYGCPHCYAFEPKLRVWRESKPKDVQFVRIPAVLNPSWGVHARTYYALDLMGVIEKEHPLIFAGIHEQNRRLSDLDSITAFLASQGVDIKKFRSTYESLPVNVSMDRAATLLERYQVTGVPTMIVNGCYATTAMMAGGYDQMIQVVNYLLTLDGVELKKTG